MPSDFLKALYAQVSAGVKESEAAIADARDVLKFREERGENTAKERAELAGLVKQVELTKAALKSRGYN